MKRAIQLLGFLLGRQPFYYKRLIEWSLKDAREMPESVFS
jgi:hypothetical protein